MAVNDWPKSWLTRVRAFEKQAGRLPKYQGHFVKTFRALLEKRLEERSKAGSRTALSTPLEEAIRLTVVEMGGKQTEARARVGYGTWPPTDKTTTKVADVSFKTSREEGAPFAGIVEVKVGLDPNSLGAAVMEGLLFQHARGCASAKFIIVSLYARSDGDDDAEERARSLLRACGLAKKTKGMSIHVLAYQPWKVSAELWNKRFARGVKELVADLDAALTR